MVLMYPLVSLKHLFPAKYFGKNTEDSLRQFDDM